MTTDTQFELVPLDCPSCGAPVAAEGEDVIYYCVACRNGYRYAPSEKGLVPVDVAFVTAAHVPAQRYMPFWELSAAVTVRERRAKGGGVGSPVAWLQSFFSNETSQQPARSGNGRFLVPAFHAGLGSTLELTRRYTQALPELGERLGERLLGGRYGTTDARKLAHFAVIASEVEKRDTLQQLRYDIRFGEPRLVGVPFVLDGERWRDSLFRVPV